MKRMFVTLGIFLFLCCSMSSVSFAQKSSAEKSSAEQSSPNTLWGPRLPHRAPQATSVKPKDIDWKREIVYFLLVDRFADGDTSNNNAAGPKSHKKFEEKLGNFEDLKTYQGGDLLGIIAKLDYLKDLGVTAIWLSPLYQNPNENFLGWWSYHGYHPLDHFSVEKTFGDMELVRKLVNEAHARGMKVILDTVYNQVAVQHPWVQDPKNWNDKGFSKWFHELSGKDDKTSIHNWEDEWELENRELYGLPDLKQDNPNVYDFLLDMSRYWIENTGADGFRLDAVKHINSNFWQRITSDLYKLYGKNFLMLGEVFHGDTKVLVRHQNDGFNALFDIPLYFDIRRVFAEGNSMEVLSNRILEESKVYSHKILWSTLIDNHDLERFSYVAKDHIREKIKNATTFLAVMNGLPVLYYGTEIALTGGPSNDGKGNGTEHLNRRMMDWGKVEIEKKPDGLITYMKNLFALRRSKKSLYDGKFVEFYKDPCVYVFAKVSEKEASLAAFNNCSVKQKVRVPVRYNLFTEGAELPEFRGTNKTKISDTALNLSLEAYSSEVYNSNNVNLSEFPKDFEMSVPVSIGSGSDFVQHRFVFEVPKATSVSVAGDFNGWNPKAHQMTQNQNTKKWEILVTMKRGKHPYKFVINGSEWLIDSTATVFENDGVGGKNSVLNIP